MSTFKTTKSKAETTKKAPPVAEYRDGLITVKVWERTNEHGTFYDISHERSYKDGETWKTTQNYPAPDVPTLTGLLQMAYADYIRQRAEDRAKAAA